MRTIETIPSQPDAPVFKRFRSAAAEHLLIVPHSRIFDVDESLANAIERQDAEAMALIAGLAQTAAGEVDLGKVVQPAVQSLSLNVSSSCNLACGYCYASQGAFGGVQPKPMTWGVARAAIDRLFTTADPQSPVTVGFLGGEPFVNRDLIHHAVKYSAATGAERGLDVQFAVTTNGTLLNASDIQLMRSYRFAVTVSIDGGPALHDAQRPLSSAKESSFERLRIGIGPLLENPGRAFVAARSTVNRFDFNLGERLEAILASGFPEVGFSPLRTAPRNAGVLRDEDWPAYLTALKNLAALELDRAERGSSIRLTNFAVALKQLYRGASSPYPCGAGGGYFSVAADGKWYACHRAIGVPSYHLGNSDGVEEARQQDFLKARHVHAQTACQTCWARYLCSGGCHQEATNRTDSACGFIRGWLEFCLSAYCELIENRPEFFSADANGAIQ
jgi:uncharacterized protein